MTSNNQFILALQVLTIKTNIQNIRKHKTIDESDVSELGTFANFSAYMSESYIRDGLIPDETAFRVNSFVEGFHDALIMYALSIDFVSIISSYSPNKSRTKSLSNFQAISRKVDWHDGRQISDLMRSRKMDGIGSQVLIDESGNRYGDYSLLAMVENDDQQFKFKVNIISTPENFY